MTPSITTAKRRAALRSGFVICLLAVAVWPTRARAEGSWVTWTAAQPGLGWRKAPIVEALFRKESKEFFAPGLSLLASLPAPTNDCVLVGEVVVSALFEQLSRGQTSREAMRKIKRSGLSELETATVCVKGDGKALTITVHAHFKSATGLVAALAPPSARLEQIAADSFATVDVSLVPSESYQLLRADETTSRFIAGIEGFAQVSLQRNLFDPWTGRVIGIVKDPAASSVRAELKLKDAAGWREFLQVLAEIGPRGLKQPKPGRFGLDLSGVPLYADLESQRVVLSPSEAGLTAKWRKAPGQQASVAAWVDGAKYAAILSRVGNSDDTLQMVRQLGFESLVDMKKKAPLPKLLLSKLGDALITADRNGLDVSMRVTINSK